MSWIEDYSALREDIHTGYIYEAIEAILYMRAHEEIPAEEQWRFSEMMGMCCRALADTEGAIAAYFEAATEDKSLRLQREHFSRYLYLCHAAAQLTPKELQPQFAMCASLYQREEPLPPRAPVHHARLRIGFLAPQFDHTAFYGALATHLTERYDVYAYALADRTNAPMSWETAGVHTAVLAQGTPQEQAERIRADEIDILIDLGGHREGGATLPVLALRPAPVQMAGLDAASTTGMPFVDAFLTDELLSPAGTEEFYSEELLRLPHALCYAADDALRRAPLAERAADAPLTFGVTQDFMCINEEALKVWGRILKKLPKAQLVLQDTEDSPLRVTTIVEMLDGLKLPMKRIFVKPGGAGVLDDGSVDVVLDTFPFSGPAAAAEALLHGTPVVTLCGETHTARRSASVLAAAGQTQWIASDARAYERIACALAEDVAALRTRRTVLRDAVLASPLTDLAAYTASVAAALDSYWDAHGAKVNQ